MVKPIIAIVTFKWNQILFECYLDSRLYEILHRPYLLIDESVTINNEYLTNLLVNEFALALFKYLRTYFSGVKFIAVRPLLGDEIAVSDFILYLDAPIELSYGNPITCACATGDDLTALELQYTSKHYKLNLPKVNTTYGNLDFQLMGNSYRLGVDEYLYEPGFAEIKKQFYLKVHFSIDGIYGHCLVNKSLIRSLARLFLNKKESYCDYSDFTAQICVDLLTSEINNYFGLNITYTDYSYSYLNKTPRNFLKICCYSQQQRQLGFILFPENFFARWQQALRQILQRPNDLVLSPNYKHKFPVVIAKSTLTVAEIEDLSVGDIVVLDHYSEEKPDIGQLEDAYLDFGNHTIRARIVNDGRQIELIDI